MRDDQDCLDEDEEDVEAAYHEPWCGPGCDGTVAMDGGFVTVPCGCHCHDECEEGYDW